MQQLNGQITISGVVNFPSGLCLAAEIKAHPDNTDTIWIGNDGNDTISNTTGYPLNAGESVTIVFERGGFATEELSDIYAVADVVDEKACWMLIDA